MLIYNSLWNHDHSQQLGEGDVLMLTLNWSRHFASAGWYHGPKPIAGLLHGNHVGWLVEFVFDSTVVSPEGRQFLLADLDIVAALDDIASAPTFDRMEFVRRRIEGFDEMTTRRSAYSPTHTCATVVTSFDGTGDLGTSDG